MLIVNHGDQAVAYFNQHFNCAQAVFTSFALEFGIDEKTALKIATGFGGGARKGEMCGAVSGALMALGLKYGHCHGENLDEKHQAYQITEIFMNRFIALNGTVVCRELLGYDISKKEDKTKIKELDLFKKVCPKMIRCAAQIAEQIIQEQPQ